MHCAAAASQRWQTGLLKSRCLKTDCETGIKRNLLTALLPPWIFKTTWFELKFLWIQEHKEHALKVQPVQIIKTFYITILKHKLLFDFLFDLSFTYFSVCQKLVFYQQHRFSKLAFCQHSFKSLAGQFRCVFLYSTKADHLIISGAVIAL